VKASATRPTRRKLFTNSLVARRSEATKDVKASATRPTRRKVVKNSQAISLIARRTIINRSCKDQQKTMMHAEVGEEEFHPIAPVPRTLVTNEVSLHY
jgi:hypothetical protein